MTAAASTARLESLRCTGLLDSPPEEAFDRLTRLSTLILGVPIALVSLVADDREFFKSAVGLTEPLASERELPLPLSFSQYVAGAREPLIVDDTRKHPVLRDNPSIRELNVRAYAAVPLSAPDGQTLGAFCVMDTAPRTWTPGDVQVVADLAAAAVTEIALRGELAQRTFASDSARDSEERYRVLFDSNPLPMWVYDSRTLCFAAVNGAAIARYGYSRAEFLAMTIADIRPPEAADALRVAARTAGPADRLPGGRQHRLKDGTLIDVEITSRPIHFDGRNCRLVLAVDVTDRRRAEAALRYNEAQLRLAIEVANMVVWERDLNTNVVVSRAIPSGPRSAHLATIATHGDFIAMVVPEDRERVVRMHEEAIATHGEISLEFRVMTPEGTTQWKQTTARVLLDDEGRPVRMVGVSRDVTERIALEAQLRQAQKMEAVGQLAGGVAHDFNNLLTVITAGVTFARETLPPDAAALAELKVVEEAAERATRLTRQLLAFGRRQVLQPELLDLNQVLRGVEPMLRRLIGEDVRILAVPSPAPAPVFADPGQIEQILVNLAVNARDAMPQGGRLIIQTASVSLTAEQLRARGSTLAPGAFVRLTVRDTGTGMDDATVARAFEPFFTTKGAGRGTGLGLATVHGIVQQSGGYVRVTSALGKGTTFEIDLPQVMGMEIVKPTEQPARPMERASGTVLLVEDEAPVRTIARRILARQGYTVVEACDGRDALVQADRHAGEIDIVVTDMVMPELSGRAFAERFSELYPGIPVLFVSGYADDEILRRGALAPRTAFLEKPFTPERLLNAVSSMMTGENLGESTSGTGETGGK